MAILAIKHCPKYSYNNKNIVKLIKNPDHMFISLV